MSTAPTPAAAGAAPRSGRAAELELGHIDPWSVLRYSSVLAVFGFAVWMVTAFALYQLLSFVGLLDSLRDLADSLFKEDARATVYSYLTLRSAMLFATTVGALGAVLSVVLATLMTFVHNIAARLTGGIVVSLRSRS